MDKFREKFFAIFDSMVDGAYFFFNEAFDALEEILDEMEAMDEASEAESRY